MDKEPLPDGATVEERAAWLEEYLPTVPRNADGTVVKGHSLNPLGRPPARRSQYLQAVRQALPPEAVALMATALFREHMINPSPNAFREIAKVLIEVEGEAATDLDDMEDYAAWQQMRIVNGQILLTAAAAQGTGGTLVGDNGNETGA